MRILVLGGDGYLGWPTAIRFASLGHEVAVVDSLIKRYWEAEVGATPLQPIPPFKNRYSKWEEVSGKSIQCYVGDIAKNPRFIYKVIEEFSPETVIHYAEQPSAPFSMLDRESCLSTHQNNVNGTLNLMFALMKFSPKCHIVKLGTMGEYGTPNIDIEEGWLELTHNGRSDRVLFPKKPGSFYHLTKVHDSANLEFAARVWNMRVTDLNQGVVYGMKTSETELAQGLHTSFHYDSIFGTVLNRFLVQSVKNYPLTVYGNGSQTRGFLNINDTLKCVQLAVENPADLGEFRVFNQFTEQFSVSELAHRVSAAAKRAGFKGEIKNLKNPRVEQENHHYQAKNSGLLALGLAPALLNDDFLDDMISTVAKLSTENLDFSDTGPLWRSK